MNKLFEAKKKIPSIKKDATNPFFKSGYASLENIIEKIEPILHESGLYISSIMEGMSLITHIKDAETGEIVERSKFDLPASLDMQKIGGAITYAKRYNLIAMLNLNIEDDDDGNGTKQGMSELCKTYSKQMNEAKSKKELETIAGELKKDKKLTDNDKSFLRNIYTERESKLK